MKIDFPLTVLSQANLISNRAIVPIPSFIPEIPCLIEDPVFNEYWERVKAHTYLDPYKAKRVWDLALEAKDIEGEFIECGSHLGGLGFLLAFLVRHFDLKKKVFLCDSFEGLPEPHPAFDTFYRKGMLAGSLETCLAFVRSEGLEKEIEVVPGWFKDTLPPIAEENKFSLVHVDCDLYESTQTCLMNLYPRSTERTPIVFDDFYIPPAGERLAVWEWIAATGERLEAGPLSQAYLRKGIGGASAKMVEDQDGMTVSLEELSLNEPYRRFLAAVQERVRDEERNLDGLIQRLKAFPR